MGLPLPPTAIHWHPYTVPRRDLAPVLRQWLINPDSLTARLQQLSAGDFSVRILSQCWRRPHHSEARTLGIDPRQLALIREVVLYGRGQPWVYARSILPRTTLTGRLRRLARLDNRPLGQLLFSDPTMYRSPIEIACYTPDHPQLPTTPANNVLWARRSSFFLDNKPLLVCETFLDPFTDFIMASN